MPRGKEHPGRLISLVADFSALGCMYVDAMLDSVADKLTRELGKHGLPRGNVLPEAVINTRGRLRHMTPPQLVADKIDPGTIIS